MMWTTMMWTGLILFREKCDRVGNSVQQFRDEGKRDRVGQKRISMGLDNGLANIENPINKLNIIQNAKFPQKHNKHLGQNMRRGSS